MTQLSKLSLQECLSAMAIKKIHQSGLSNIVKEILEERTKMIEEFSPLLEYVIDQLPEKLISSEELYALWIFFCIGIYHVSLELMKSKTEFSVKDLTRLGPVVSRKILYDRCYKLLADSPSNEVFESSNPTEWYNKAIKTSGNIESFFKGQQQDDIIPILEQVCIALSDPDCDPVKQR